MNDFLGGLAVNNSPHPRAAKPSHHNHWAHVPQAESLCAATKTQADKVNKEKLQKRQQGEMYHFREQLELKLKTGENGNQDRINKTQGT